MKGLTLTQPWATLVAIGAKRIETRSWQTSYRGPLAIHAGAGLGPVGGERGLMELCRAEPFRSTLLGAGILGTPELPRGAIVAVVNLDSIWRLMAGGIEGFSPQPPANELAFGNYAPGRFGWLLGAIKPLPEPVPCRGAQGLWNVPAEVQAQIRAQL